MSQKSYFCPIFGVAMSYIFELSYYLTPCNVQNFSFLPKVTVFFHSLQFSRHCYSKLLNLESPQYVYVLFPLIAMATTKVKSPLLNTEWIVVIAPWYKRDFQRYVLLRTTLVISPQNVTLLGSDDLCFEEIFKSSEEHSRLKINNKATKR